MKDINTSTNTEVKETIYVAGAPRKIMKRPTYSWQRAQRFKPVFDTIIESRKSTIVPCPSNEVQPNTLRAALADALLWLIDNFDEPWRDLIKDKYSRNDYAALKGQTKFRIVEGGVMIHYLASMSEQQTTMVANLVTIDKEANKEWRKQVTQFLVNYQQPMLIIKNIVLTKVDIEWLNNVLEDCTEFQQRITPSSIELVR